MSEGLHNNVYMNFLVHGLLEEIQADGGSFLPQ